MARGPLSEMIQGAEVAEVAEVTTVAVMAMAVMAEAKGTDGSRYCGGYRTRDLGGGLHSESTSPQTTPGHSVLVKMFHAYRRERVELRCWACRLAPVVRFGHSYLRWSSK